MDLLPLMRQFSWRGGEDMIKKIAIIATGSVLSLASMAYSLPALANTCTSVSTSKGTLTAKVVDPVAPVTSDVDASGCNIGVYFSTVSGSVDNANVHGANYYGVFVDGKTNDISVDVTDSSIHNIGESPLNGAQHGLGIYYYGYNTTGSVTGTVSGNEVSSYQKNGITVNGEKASVDIEDNTVTGEGRVDYIAQNGIQVGFGATGNVSGNTVTGNFYMTGQNMRTGNGPWVSCGLLYYATGLSKAEQASTMANNTIRSNQVNLCNY